MAKTFTAVANTDNFETWLNRTNDMIGEFANVVTVEGSAATGNAVITGSIQVGNVYASNLYGGTIGSVGTLNLASNVDFKDEVTFSGGDVTMSSGNLIFTSAKIDLDPTEELNLGVFTRIKVASAPGGNTLQNFVGVNGTTGAFEYRTLSSVMSFNDLSDVSLVTPSTNSALFYNTSSTDNEYITFKSVVEQGAVSANLLQVERMTIVGDNEALVVTNEITANSINATLATTNLDGTIFSVGNNTTHAVTQGDNVKIIGTSNEITVDAANTDAGNKTITVGFPDDIVIPGSLSVNEGLTTDELNVTDEVIANTLTVSGSASISGAITDATDITVSANGNFANVTVSANIIYKEGANSTTIDFTTPSTTSKVITVPDVTGTIITNANADEPTTTTTASHADHFLINDGGVMKKIAPGSVNVSQFNNDSGFITSSTYSTPAELLTAIKTVDGTTSGLDGDLLDGQHGAHYLAFANFTGAGSYNISNFNNNANFITLGSLAGSGDIDYDPANGTIHFEESDTLATVTARGATTSENLTLTGSLTSNTLSVTNSTATSVTVAANGNVGIADTTPTQKLFVDGNIATTQDLIFETGSFNTTTIIANTATADRDITLPDRSGVVFLEESVADLTTFTSSDNTDKVLINDGGTLKQHNLSSLKLSLMNNDSGFITAESDTLATVTARGATTAQNLTVTGSLAANTLSVTNSTATSVSIVANGNVGIATATPGEKLEVDGNIKLENLILANTSTGIEYQSGGAADNKTTVNFDVPSQNRTITFPDSNGKVITDESGGEIFGGVAFNGEAASDRLLVIDVDDSNKIKPVIISNFNMSLLNNDSGFITNSADIIPNSSNTIHLGNTTVGFANVYIANTRSIVWIGTNGPTITGTTDGLSVTRETTLASATVSDLTDNRVVIAGTSGALEDSADLTFDGSSLTVGGATSFVSIDTSGSITANGTISIDSKLNVNDQVGIGTDAPQAALHVAGDIVATGDVTTGFTSDERLKENISYLENPLEILEEIDGVRFKWKKGIDENFSQYISPKEGEDIGVIAQDVEMVLPEVVRTYPDGYKGVDYAKFVPVLLEAIKHLNSRVKQLENQVNSNGDES